MISSNNISFIDILVKEFNGNKRLRDRCIQSGLSKIQKGMVSRVFDDYPALLAENELSFYADNFKKIYEQINKDDVLLENMQLINQKDLAALREFELILINRACRELLDNNGKIRFVVINLLGWQDHLHKIKITDLICAYVAAVNACIMNNNSSLLNQDTIKSSAVCDYVNKNYSHWVKDKLLSAYKIAEREERSDFEKILYLPIDKPVIGIGLGLGIAAVSGLALTGILFFSSRASEGGGGSLELSSFTPK